MRWQSKAVIAGLVGGAVYGAYRAVAHPESRLFGPVYSRGRAGNCRIALTFDDGPDATWTPRMATLLRRFNIRATFFCLGRLAERCPEIIRGLVDDGHEIGNHSYSHRNLWYRSAAQVRTEIERCQAVLSASSGTFPRLFRPPFGDRGPQVISQARSLNLSTVLWSVDSKDWNSPAAETLYRRVRDMTRDGDILLFHDGSYDGRFLDRSATAAALTALVPWFLQQQFEFVTVSSLMNSIGEAQ